MIPHQFFVPKWYSCQLPLAHPPVLQLTMINDILITGIQLDWK